MGEKLEREPVVGPSQVRPVDTRPTEDGARVEQLEDRVGCGHETVEQLRDQLDEAVDQSAILARQLRETRSSTAFLCGKAIVSALNNPRTLWKLPSQLLGLYRGRGTTRNDVVGMAPDRDAHLFSAYPAGFDSGSVIATIASRNVVATLRRVFNVIPIWPNDASYTGDEAAPDVLIIESGAAMPGEVWTTLGTGLGVGLERTLVDLIARFQRRSIPVVFWWTTPASQVPGLTEIADRCDLEVSDHSTLGAPDATPFSLGINLGQLFPIHPHDRPTGASRPLLHLGPYDPDPHTAPSNRIVQAALAAGGDALYDPSHLHKPDDTLWPSTVKSRYGKASWTTPTAVTGRLSHRSIAMLAAGVPTLVTRSTDEYVGAVTEVPSETDVLEAATDASQRASNPSYMAEILRTVHKYGTTRTQVSSLFSHLGLNARVANREDEIGIWIDAWTDPERVVSCIAEQSVLPTEVVTDDRRLRELLRPGLDAAGIATPLPEHRKAPRHAHWGGNETWPNTHLQDVLIAANITGANLLDGSEVVMTTFGNGVRQLPWWMAKTRGD